MFKNKIHVLVGCFSRVVLIDTGPTVSVMSLAFKNVMREQSYVYLGQNC